MNIKCYRNYNELNYSIKLRKEEKQMAKKIVILGAGYAGVHAAKKLAKK